MPSKIQPGSVLRMEIEIIDPDRSIIPLIFLSCTNPTDPTHSQPYLPMFTTKSNNLAPHFLYPPSHFASQSNEATSPLGSSVFVKVNNLLKLFVSVVLNCVFIVLSSWVCPFYIHSFFFGCLSCQ